MITNLSPEFFSVTFRKTCENNVENYTWLASFFLSFVCNRLYLKNLYILLRAPWISAVFVYLILVCSVWKMAFYRRRRHRRLQFSFHFASLNLNDSIEGIKCNNKNVFLQKQVPFTLSLYLSIECRWFFSFRHYFFFVIVFLTVSEWTNEWKFIDSKSVVACHKQ